MKKLEVSSEVTEWCKLLPPILENALNLEGVSQSQLRDTCFMMAMVNWYHGDNEKRMSVDKFAVANTREWQDILKLLGVSALKASDTNNGLPRVQQERVLFDALALNVFRSSDDEVQKNIALALEKSNLDSVKYSVETNRNGLIPKAQNITFATGDIEETELADTIKFWVTFTNLCKGIVEEEKKEEEPKDEEEEISDEDIKEVLEYYDKHADEEMELPEKTGIPQDLMRLCKFLVNTHPIVLTYKYAKIVKENFYASYDKMMVDKIAESDSVSTRLRLQAFADSLKDSGKEVTIYWTEEMKEALYLMSTDLFEILVVMFGGSPGTAKSLKNGAKVLTAITCESEEDLEQVLLEIE